MTYLAVPVIVVLMPMCMFKSKKFTDVASSVFRCQVEAIWVNAVETLVYL